MINTIKSAVKHLVMCTELGCSSKIYQSKCGTFITIHQNFNFIVIGLHKWLCGKYGMSVFIVTLMGYICSNGRGQTHVANHLHYVDE